MMKNLRIQQMWPVSDNFCVTVTKKLSIQQIEKLYAILIVKDSFLGNHPSLKIIPITETEM
jgi:hypothetical protein